MKAVLLLSGQMDERQIEWIAGGEGVMQNIDREE